MTRTCPCTWRACVWALVCALGCGEDEAPQAPPPPPGVTGEAAPAPAPAPSESASQATGENPIGEVTFTDDDFVESESNRDPFRSYETTFQVKTAVVPQRLVLMPDVAIDQMRLIAIISGVDTPRAMLVDPSGVGHVASRGDFLGRAEVVQTGGRDSLPVTLNWRVDRIRSAEVVLAREDPSSPNRAPLTRVLPLHDESEIVGTLERSEEGEHKLPSFGAKTGGG